MSALDLNGEYGRSVNEIDRCKIVTLNVIMEIVDCNIDEIDEKLGKMREYIIQQVEEYRPIDMSTTVEDFNFRNNIIFQIVPKLNEIKSTLNNTSHNLTNLFEALEDYISPVASIEGDQKKKELNCKELIEEKKKAEIEIKSKSKPHRMQQFMLTNIQMLIQASEKMRLEAISNLQLLNELLHEAENLMRRVEIRMIRTEFLLTETTILIQRLEQERDAIKTVLRRKAIIIAEEANRQEGQAMTAATVVILGILAALISNSPQR